MDIKIARPVLEENAAASQAVRGWLRDRRAVMVNFMSSPGSGKTALLEQLIPRLQTMGFSPAVVEGDITTARDADRLHKFNVPVSLVNTEPFGGDCHVGAHMIHNALQQMAEADFDIVLLENIGNLVCPAEFDAGANLNCVVFSITEGEDKPLKYPLMFRVCSLALISKVDLQEAVQSNLALLKQNMRRINPEIDILEVSGKTGQGVEALAAQVAALAHEGREGG